MQKNVDAIARSARNSATPVSEVLPLKYSGELQLPLIDSLTNDVERIMQVNVPNLGTIQGIPDDVVVEGKAVVSGKGVQLLQVGKLPETLMEQVMYPRQLLLEQTLSAYVNHDKELLRDIVREDHRTKTPEQAKHLIEAIFALPHNAEIAHWYNQ